MGALEIAVVSRDEDVRLEAARAFDGAPRSWSVRLFEAVPEGADVVVIGPDIEHHGRAIRFEPGRADNLLGAIERYAVTRSVCVYVISSSGGCGVTTICLHLAASLAAKHATCYVESTWGGAGARLSLPDDHRTWVELERPEGSLELAALPVPGGFRALLAPEGARASSEIVERARRGFDYVIVDARLDQLDPARPEEDALVLMVVPPTRTGARRARATLGDGNLGWTVITNRTGLGGDLGRVELQNAIGHRVLDHLPYTPRLRGAEDEGDLLSSRWNLWSRKVDRLALALMEA